MIIRDLVQYAPRLTAHAVVAGVAVLCFGLLDAVPGLAATQGVAPAVPVSRPGSVPNWAIGAMWYLVDVPHFANGDRSNDLSGTADWPTRLAADTSFHAGHAKAAVVSYGGDLAGLAQRLPYLKDLGVNALYLTGLFRHGGTPARRTFDYRHIDDYLGEVANPNVVHDETADSKTWGFTPSDRRFVDFIKQAHRQGFRVVIGIAVGSAQSGIPGVGATPKVDADITRRWMDPNGDGHPEDGIDGWVVRWFADLPHDGLRHWRQQVKSLNPEALIVADAKRDAHVAVASGLFDTVINRPAGGAIRRFFGDVKGGVAPATLLDELIASISGMSVDSYLASPVLLGNWSASAHTVAPDANLAAQWRLATIMQHFFSGSPMTYYGDEMGLRGGKGGDSPRTMLWPDLPGTDPSVQKYRDDFASLLQWLHARRGVDVPLRRGKFRPVLADRERRLLAFARSTEKAEVIVLMNYGATKQKVMLPVGHSGMKVSVLTPLIDPRRKLVLRQPTASLKDRISPRRMAASRQLIRDDGLARLWVDPMSIRVVLTSGE